MDPVDLTGPFGGYLALAFASGCASTYAFMMRSITKLEGKIEELENEVHTLRDLLIAEAKERVNEMSDERKMLLERVLTEQKEHL